MRTTKEIFAELLGIDPAEFEPSYTAEDLITILLGGDEDDNE